MIIKLNNQLLLKKFSMKLNKNYKNTNNIKLMLKICKIKRINYYVKKLLINNVILNQILMVKIYFL